jgi:IgA Peptidase M64/Peptidase M64 N-terminus
MLRLAAAALALLGSCAQLAPAPAPAPVAPGAPAAPVAPVAAVAPGFDFTRTIRVDYFHSGGPGGEALKLDAVIVEGAWPGSQTQLIDTTNLGKYFFEVVDPVSNRVIYSRGFATMYGEWETTPEFRATDRTFHESLRFPRPSASVRISIKKRDEANVFRLLWEREVDPRPSTSLGAGAAAPSRRRLSTMLETGPPSRKVDLLLISDGYAAAQTRRFHADARRLINALFELEPFKSRRADFNVRTLHAPASPARVEFSIFGLDRYALSNDNRALRNVAAAAPYDVIEILANETKYGGGGIFNQQSTVSAGHESAAYVFIHELAHNLAGLGDEYVGSVTYETGAAVHAEPWEPNITALHDPSALKWRDLVEPGTPVPTPMSYAGKVGAFEGAGYEVRGLYRSEAACIMGTRTVMNFCRVCQRAINRIIDLHTR